uniref:Acetyltransferase (Virginiamycin, streptogramin A, chloramphenicol) n=2 Tax=Magnetospirillum gryphiswaldense TaxID=55518 RepID=A4U4J3_9PROT|nr:acetyltransferase (Virginiamycin, streptogramin A, chloramphenicol) [Magnetospirillum gryphiswaldense MSR-1]
MMETTMSLSENPWIDPAAEVSNCTLGAYTAVHARTQMRETAFGDYSYMMEDGDCIYADIGKFVSIARMVRINPGNHPLERASIHHFTYRASSYGLGDDDLAFFDWRRDHRVSIGHDVWIGHGAIIMAGITIGTGAVVGAGSVVTHDVAPYTIVAGVPAKPIRRRVTVETEAQLLSLSWWDWPHDKLKQALPDFRTLNAEQFIDKYHPG